jgi:hypothetical protein
MASRSNKASRKRGGADDDDSSYNHKLGKKEGKEEMKPVVEDKPEDSGVNFVHHIYTTPADVRQGAEATANVAKGLLSEKTFCKMLISTRRPYHGGTFRNTTPCGRSGVNHSTPWTDPAETVRAEIRFFSENPNNHTTLVKVTMWTAHALATERLLLRTLIKTDASQAAVDDMGWVYNHYFSITAEELEKNMGKTTFLFKADISMQSE